MDATSNLETLVQDFMRQQLAPDASLEEREALSGAATGLARSLLRELGLPGDVSMPVDDAANDAEMGSPGAMIGVVQARAGQSPDSLVRLFVSLRSALMAQGLAQNPGTAVTSGEVFQVLDRELEAAVSAFTVEATRARDVFMAGIAHELRGPLSAIRLSAAYLGRVANSPEIAKASVRVATSAARLKSLVDDLVDFSDERLQGMTLQRAPLDLRACITEELDRQSQQWPDRDLRLEVQGPIDGAWDGRRISQLVGHLIEFACEGGEDREPVIFSVTGSSAGVTLTVSRAAHSDEAARLADAFAPMQARMRDTLSNARAVSLGLALTRTIAQAHGGDAVLHFESGRLSVLVQLPR